MSDRQLSSSDTKKYYIYLMIMIITGACNTIFIKLQNDAYASILNAPFNHPWFQTFVMFIGESYCAVLWIFWKNSIRANEDKKQLEKGEEIDSRPDPPVWVFLISCSFDVLGTTLLNFALTMMPASIFQMLRGGIVIITSLFTILFIKRNPKNFQWLGVFLVFLGVFLVGLASQIHRDPDAPQQDTKIIAIVMVLLSLIFTGFQFVYQEIILSKYRTSPLQLVAWEGTWGLSITLILMTIFTFIPCSESIQSTCALNGETGIFTLENPIYALRQIWENKPMILYVVGNTFSIGLFNYFGIMIVSFASSATRSVMDSARTIIIWVFFIIVPLQGKTQDFYALQLTGFIIMVTGQLIYNQLMSVNMFGFDEILINNILEKKEDPKKVSDKIEISSTNDDKKDKLLETKNNISYNTNNE